MVLMLLFSLISSQVYKLSEKHIGKKMDKGAMKLYTTFVKGDSIEYWDNSRDKPVIVLVHGFGASTKYQWFKQVEWLSKNYRIIMPNLLHFGNTRPGAPKYKVSDQVEMVESLIDHLNIDKYTLCGVSYGGLISMELAVKFPLRVERLIAFDAPVKYIHKSDVENVKERFDVASIEELFAPNDERGLKKLMYLATSKKIIFPASWMREFYNELYAVNLEDKRKLITELINGLEEYASHDYPLEMPVLLIWGSNDPVVPSERSQLLQEHIGENAKCVVIKNGGHMPNLTKTKIFDKVIKDFLLIN